MMGKHTEGPWRYEYTEPGETDCNFVLSHVSMDADDEGRTRDYGGSLLEGQLMLENDGENEANARLIAAAPDLFAACERVLPLLSVPSIVRQVREAIARAHGEEESR